MTLRDFRHCEHCERPARLTPGAEIWPHRPDLAHKAAWKCDGCGRYVGCHPGTSTPLGRLADDALRAAKMRAHAAFDPLWKAKMNCEGCSKGRARSLGYQWLATQLGIDPADCHIGHFDVAMCERVVEICGARRRVPNQSSGESA